MRGRSNCLCCLHRAQYIEYNELPFTLTDSPYGTTFFITTGFHGMHVLLGAIFLAAAAASYSRTKTHGVMMKSSILYWHFVGEARIPHRGEGGGEGHAAAMHGARHKGSRPSHVPSPSAIFRHATPAACLSHGKRWRGGLFKAMRR